MFAHGYLSEDTRGKSLEIMNSTQFFMTWVSSRSHAHDTALIQCTVDEGSLEFIYGWEQTQGTSNPAAKVVFR